MGTKAILPYLNSILWVVIRAKYQSDCSWENVWKSGWQLEVGTVLLPWYSVLPYGQKNSKFVRPGPPSDHVMSFMKIHYWLTGNSKLSWFFFSFSPFVIRNLCRSMYPLALWQILLILSTYLRSRWRKLGLWFVAIKWNRTRLVGIFG